MHLEFRALGDKTELTLIHGPFADMPSCDRKTLCPGRTPSSVRVQHAKDKPVLVKLRDGKHKGEEHRFYSDANKYTATFWDLADPNQQNFKFAIIFLNSFKASATPAVFTITGHSPNFDPPDDRMGN